jgi:hypothetical protein
MSNPLDRLNAPQPDRYRVVLNWFAETQALLGGG